MTVQAEPVEHEISPEGGVQTEILLLRREIALRKRELELRKSHAIEFFRPHAKQELFFAAAEYRFRYARTGNRFGKSEMGACEDIAFALGYRPWYPEGNPLRTLGLPKHPTKGVIVTTDWDKSSEVFTEQEGENKGKLFKYIPAGAIESVTRNHSGAIDRIVVRHVSGGLSVIHLDTVKSYKQNPLGQESSSWDWVHVDEPCPEGMWKALVRGLTDRGGKAWFTCTPISEPWIDLQFVPNIEDQSKENLGVIANEQNSRWMMTGSMDDNPHLSSEDIALTLSWYTPEEQEARRKGIPIAYSGIVYKEFDWNVHVRRETPIGWSSWDEPPADYTLRFAIDYHPRKPHAVMFIATSPQGMNYVYAELWTDVLMNELVDEIRCVLRGRESTIPGLIDPLASTPNRVTDLTAIDEILRLGLPVMPATKDPHNGILKVKQLLASRDRTGQPLIVFNGNLPRTLFEISRGFVWDGDKQKPVKNNDDMMENFYRLCLQGLDYIEPSDTYYIPRIGQFANTFDTSLDFGVELDYADKPSKLAIREKRYRR